MYRMARTKHNYQNNCIYMIKCKDEKIIDCYVGQTCDHYRRKAGHKSACKKDGNRLYQFMNTNGGWDNWTFEIIEKYPCDNSIEARIRENYWINFHNANLNTNVHIDELIDNKSWYAQRKMDMYKMIEDNKEHHQLRLTEQKDIYEKLMAKQNIEYEKLKAEWFSGIIHT